MVSLVLLSFLASPSSADDWPQWLGPQRDAIWREQGILEKFPNDGPKVRWRTPVGIGYAGPAVAAGRVFVPDFVLQKGKTLPRSGFGRFVLPGTERILCLDEATGKVLWQHEYSCTYRMQYPAGPRTTPVIHAGKVYFLGGMGDLLCLDAGTGKVIWSKNLQKEYQAPLQTWGFSASPLVDGDKLICLVGGKAAVAAFDLNTGKELWQALQVSQQGYCPPVIVKLGGKRQLIIWHPEAVNGLDPETGKVYWSQPFEVRAGLTISMPRAFDNDRLFVTAFYNGPLLLQVDPNEPAPRVVWKGRSNSEAPRNTDGLHSIMVTPFIKDGYIYGVCSYGQLRCLKADTGKRIWETLKATGGKLERWANAFIVAQGDRFFLFDEKGDLIIARLTPKGYEEIDRTHLLAPTNTMPGRLVVWSHPAFANKSIYARNDKEIVCVSLAAEGGK